MNYVDKVLQPFLTNDLVEGTNLNLSLFQDTFAKEHQRNINLNKLGYTKVTSYLPKSSYETFNFNYEG